MTPLEVAIVLFAAGLLVLILGVLWADALDGASEVDWEAEEYADLVSRKHDAANEILGYTAWGVEMMHHAALQPPSNVQVINGHTTTATSSTLSSQYKTTGGLHRLDAMERGASTPRSHFFTNSEKRKCKRTYGWWSQSSSGWS